MSVNVSGLEIDGVRGFTEEAGCFKVLEYERDVTVAPDNAMTQFFMAEMEVRRRQLVAVLGPDDPGVIMQAGAMQMMFGGIDVATDVKGVGGLFKGAVRGKGTGESLKSSFGAFLGFLSGTGIKLISSALMLYYIIVYI